jgi:ring-1,2-phenylacetyl-CoA epoxidase subunit PaaC
VSETALRPAVARYCLGLGDDALVLAQRLCEWAAGAPAIEEDIALMNIALDLIGQARSFLSHAGELEGAGRTEDDLAFGRDERDFLNVQIVELANGDFGTTMARQLLFSAYQYQLYSALSSSADEQITAIAAKAVKEVAYHREHAASWVLRLGDGTEESHARMAAGLEVVWPFAGELFELFEPLEPLEPLDSDDSDGTRHSLGAGSVVNELFTTTCAPRQDSDTGRSAGRSDDSGPVGLLDARIIADPASLYRPWLGYVQSVLTEATLEVPSTTWSPGGGRRGLHTEGFGYLLAEMQHLHRSYPGATW